jgi:hypothetical protein
VRSRRLRFAGCNDGISLTFGDGAEIIVNINKYSNASCIVNNDIVKDVVNGRKYVVVTMFVVVVYCRQVRCSTYVQVRSTVECYSIQRVMRAQIQHKKPTRDETAQLAKKKFVGAKLRQNATLAPNHARQISLLAPELVSPGSFGLSR